MRISLLAVLFLTVVSARAAEPVLPQLKFTQTTLSNGLKVVLAPDHQAPVFGINVAYRVGSRDEVPGLTGFAHLFEHMMFQGSANVGKGEHFILITNNGGGINGATHDDYTDYYEQLPKNQLDLALFLEADRMRSLAVNLANLENQRKAVQEEKRLRIDNQPYAPSEEEIDNLAFDDFAYKHSAFGEMIDLERAKVQDLRAFFKTHYAPNNAVLILVGDFEPAAALEKIKKYFGPIPSQPAQRLPLFEEPAHLGERRETVEDPLARLPRLFAAYHIPPGNTPENYAIQAVGIVLGQGHSSRLYQRLVKERQLATSISAGGDSRQGPSLFYIDATPRPGVSVADLEKAIYQEIESLQKDGVTEREFGKARRQYLSGFISERATYLQTAVSIAEDAAKWEDPGLINTEIDKFYSVTRTDIKNAAAKYLIPRERVVVITMPKKKAPEAGQAKP